LSCVTAALHSHEEIFKSERRFQILPVPAAQYVVALGQVPKTKRHRSKKNKKNASLGANKYLHLIHKNSLLTMSFASTKEVKNIEFQNSNQRGFTMFSMHFLGAQIQNPDLYSLQ
jgi:hypothetical protein